MAGNKVLVTRELIEGLSLLLDELRDYDLGDDVKTILRALEREVVEKKQAMERQAIFTAYKTGERGTDEREACRKDYLDRVDIHRDWRSEGEISY